MNNPQPQSATLTALQQAAAPKPIEAPYDARNDPAWASKKHILAEGDNRDYINKLKPADRSKLLHILSTHDRYHQQRLNDLGRASGRINVSPEQQEAAQNSVNAIYNKLGGAESQRYDEAVESGYNYAPKGSRVYQKGYNANTDPLLNSLLKKQ